MSEYWVSQKKYFCEICKVWMSDNKQSRSMHEGGFSHTNKLELHLKAKKDAKLHGARSERELEQTLKEIEKAARAAVADDRTNSDSFFYQKPTAARPAPPPPPMVSLNPSFGGAGKKGTRQTHILGILCQITIYFSVAALLSTPI
jgi:hypothetical protein